MLLAQPELECAARRVSAPSPRRVGRPPKPCERCGATPAKDRNSFDGKAGTTRDTSKDHGFAEGFRLCDECYAGIVTGRLQPPRKSLPPREEIHDFDDAEYHGFDPLVHAVRDVVDNHELLIWEQVNAVSDAKTRNLLDQIAGGKGIREIEDEQHWEHGTGLARLRAAVGGES